MAPKAPKVPPPPKPPDKSIANDAAENDTRKRILAAKGTQQNIFSSPLGDPNYGKSSVAPTAVGTTFFANFGQPSAGASLQ
jgi:hypothetical protein